jgi:hypothetical protein
MLRFNFSYHPQSQEGSRGSCKVGGSHCLVEERPICATYSSTRKMLALPRDNGLHLQTWLTVSFTVNIFRGIDPDVYIPCFMFSGLSHQSLEFPITKYLGWEFQCLCSSLGLQVDT